MAVAPIRTPDPARWRLLPAPARHRSLGPYGVAESEVRVGTQVLQVRIVRNGVITGLGGLAGGPDPASVLRFLYDNIRRFGDTGWTVTVAVPETRFRAARTLFRQPVLAAALVVDIAEVIRAAAARGERFWEEPDDDD